MTKLGILVDRKAPDRTLELNGGSPRPPGAGRVDSRTIGSVAETNSPVARRSTATSSLRHFKRRLPPPRDQIKEQHDNRDDEQQVNKAARNMANEAEDPKNDEDNDDGIEHKNFFWRSNRPIVNRHPTLPHTVPRAVSNLQRGWRPADWPTKGERLDMRWKGISLSLLLMATAFAQMDPHMVVTP